MPGRGARRDVPMERRRTHFYGTPTGPVRPLVRDNIILRNANPEAAADLENKEKERLAKEDALRVPEDQVKKLDVLTVLNIDLHVKDNAQKHHTSMFHCVKTENQPVFRRGEVFQMTLTFNREYQKRKDDLHLILEADTKNPAKNLQVTFTMDEERWVKYDPKTDEDFLARMVTGRKTSGQNKLNVEVYIPGNCVVGEWVLKVMTTLEGSKDDYIKVCDKPIFILFNPWSKADTVRFKEKDNEEDNENLLKEYVLNESGTVFVGTSKFSSSFAWTYGQFEESILQASFSILRRAFNFKMTPDMADPVMVSRALSRIVNSQDDQGVVVGNWGDSYEDGVAPWLWKSSTAILRQYAETGEPVKYGQCWVFSHVLTAVCRALGIPCRSVTNFDSAHDTDNSCTVDKYFSEDGQRLGFFGRDSIWNFHVWNEVWLLRPDLPSGYDGWHCIDATPQEQSLGMFQCGPCPITAVKEGNIHIGYDTAFVFSEVNADVVNWVIGPDVEEHTRYSSIDRKYVGQKISTKVPDGKPSPHQIDHYTSDDSDVRLDITENYKFKEGTPEEREAVERAVRFCRYGSMLYKDTAEVEVTINEDKKTMVGRDLVVEAKVKNISKEAKRVVMTMASRKARYWDFSTSDDMLASEKFNVVSLKPQQEEIFKLTTPVSAYMEQGKDSGFSLVNSIHVYACARDLDKDMVYSSERPFNFQMPELKIEGSKSAKSGEKVTFTVAFTNPLSHITLTDVTFRIDGGLTLAGEDPRFVLKYGSYKMESEDIKPGETRTVQVALKGETDEPEGQSKQVSFTFDTKELPNIRGSHKMDIEYVKSPEVEEPRGEATE